LVEEKRWHEHLYFSVIEGRGRTARGGLRHSRSGGLADCLEVGDDVWVGRRWAEGQVGQGSKIDGLGKMKKKMNSGLGYSRGLD
jgi:hypothetical protein